MVVPQQAPCWNLAKPHGLAWYSEYYTPICIPRADSQLSSASYTSMLQHSYRYHFCKATLSYPCNTNTVMCIPETPYISPNNSHKFREVNEVYNSSMEQTLKYEAQSGGLHNSWATSDKKRFYWFWSYVLFPSNYAKYMTTNLDGAQAQEGQTSTQNLKYHCLQLSSLPRSLCFDWIYKKEAFLKEDFVFYHIWRMYAKITRNHVVVYPRYPACIYPWISFKSTGPMMD